MSCCETGGAMRPRTALVHALAFTVGHDNASFPHFSADREGPPRTVHLDSYHIARTETSNRDFSAFVDAMGYTTTAERYGWSFVFDAQLTPEAEAASTECAAATPWWIRVTDASWKAPRGPGSTYDPDHPVVHVSWYDARAFCEWKGGRLPTEAEWEAAAAGGVDSTRVFPWGDELVDDTVHRCNIWQGKWPAKNTAEDGFLFTAPVSSFPPQNDLGLHHMAGNVWEWTSDVWDGPEETHRTKKGGSFLCHETSCYRYRTKARSSNDAESTTSNLGFRCAWST